METHLCEGINVCFDRVQRVELGLVLLEKLLLLLQELFPPLVKPGHNVGGNVHGDYKVPDEPLPLVKFKVETTEHQLVFIR